MLELSRERDFCDVFPVRMRYVILTSPRAGSTLIGRMLYKTQLAGDPIEYFNRYLLELERFRTGRSGLTYQDFLSDMERRRTSPNGIFGMQLHYSQFLKAFSARQATSVMSTFIRNFDKLIWVRRRDRLRQAVSFVIAKRKRAWSSEDVEDETFLDSMKVSPMEILGALSIVCQNDLGWERCIKAMNLDVHEIWYEDVASDYEAQCSAVLEHIGIADLVEDVPPPQISRQTSGLNERLISDIYAYLGVDLSN